MHVGKLPQPKPKKGPKSINPTQTLKQKLSHAPVLISEKDSVNLNELQGHVNNWREIICDFAKEGFQNPTQNTAISLVERKVPS